MMTWSCPYTFHLRKLGLHASYLYVITSNLHVITVSNHISNNDKALTAEPAHLNEGLRAFSMPEVWCTGTAAAERQLEGYE